MSNDSLKKIFFFETRLHTTYMKSNSLKNSPFYLALKIAQVWLVPPPSITASSKEQAGKNLLEPLAELRLFTDDEEGNTLKLPLSNNLSPLCFMIIPASKLLLSNHLFCRAWVEKKMTSVSMKCYTICIALYYMIFFQLASVRLDFRLIYIFLLQL